MVAAPSRDFYAVLGVGKTCGAAELKAAYRRLALQHHPDKTGGDDTQFKAIAEAYAVLSDADKRAIYDRFGEEGLRSGMSAEDAKRYGGDKGGPQGGFHMPPEFAEQLFAQFFAGGANGMGGGRRRAQPQQQSPGFATFSFGGGDFGGMQFGEDHQQQQQGMPTFGGMRFGGGSHNGMETEPQAMTKKETIERDVHVELEDLLTGVTKRLKVTRKVRDDLSGQFIDAEKTIELPIKPGMKQGARFTFKNLGSEEPGFEPADMVFVLRERPHKRFKREADDLVTKVDVPLRDALVGGSVRVEALDGRLVRVPFGPLADTSTTTVLPDEGLPNPKTGIKGSMVVGFNVKLPPPGSEQRRKAVESLL
jgi:DnaJ-class molecular chaperone